MVIPTLAADEMLIECLESLERQSSRDFEIIVVDNSGRGAVRLSVASRPGLTILESGRNIGFGAAVNAACARSRAPFLATLNDDAAAHPRWLEALVEAAASRDDVGMCASRVLLAGVGRLDSAGMLLCADGSSKQRGHGECASRYDDPCETLLPSGAAALYRRAMLEETGGFDETFFLYSEDTDLGLRARWAGWKCLYVPEAQVEHRYSRSAGRASPLKAYHVERNRLFVVAKNFPAGMLAKSPWVALARYAWHAVAIVEGRGAGAEFLRQGHGAWRLAWLVLRAHLAALAAAPRLWIERRKIRGSARLSAAEFRRLARSHSIRAREVARL